MSVEKEQNEQIAESKENEILSEDINLPESYLGLAEHNNSHYFLTPMFNIKGVLKYRKNYINSYIGDMGRRTELDSPLYCLFKFKELEGDYDRVSEYFTTLPQYAFSYYAGTNDKENLVMYVLKASDIDKQDYKNVVEGKYSYVSTRYRATYRKFGFSPNTVQFLEDITLKKPAFKNTMEKFLNVKLDDKAELWNKFEPHREIFRYKYLSK